MSAQFIRHSVLLLVIQLTSITAATHPDFIGIHEAQGRRPTMEDAHHYTQENGYFFCGLYDGHGGRDVADFAARNLHKNIAPLTSSSKIPAALAHAYLKTHADLSDAPINGWYQGCTAVTALVKNSTLYVAHAGDSRAVLARSGKAIALTQDHKPDRPDEKKRIEDLGGMVFKAGGRGPARVQGMLAIARALGDKALNPYVTAQPDVASEKLTDNDNFLILACDGLWDVMDCQTAVDIAAKSLEKDTNLDTAARLLVDTALQKGSTDNVSVIIIDLKKLKRSSLSHNASKLAVAHKYNKDLNNNGFFANIFAYCKARLSSFSKQAASLITHAKAAVLARIAR